MSEPFDLHAGRSHSRRHRPASEPPRPPEAPTTTEHAESDQPRGQATAPATSPGPVMVFVRYVLPGLVVIAGLIAMAFGSDVALEGGAGLVGAGLAIWLINWLFRIGARGDAEREAEDRAREYFDLHGRWPEGR